MALFRCLQQCASHVSLPQLWHSHRHLYKVRVAAYLAFSLPNWPLDRGFGCLSAC